MNVSAGKARVDDATCLAVTRDIVIRLDLVWIGYKGGSITRAYKRYYIDEP